jgi:hypothetical protein
MECMPIPTRALRTALLLLLGVVASVPAVAEQAWETKNTHSERVRNALRGLGVGFELLHSFEAIGTRGSSPLAAALTDLSVSFRPSRLKRTRLAGTYSLYGQSGPLQTAEIQSVSNLTAPPYRQWREFYVETLTPRGMRIKGGRVDANTEFSVVDSAADFSNAAAGVNPSLADMPSYPQGALSANVFMPLTKGISAGTGVYRLAGGRLYVVAEGEIRWSRSRPGRFVAGVWRQSGSTAGSYVVAEQTLLRRGAGEGLKAFTRLSLAGKAVAEAALHEMYGVSLTGLGSRRRDSVGAAGFHLLPHDLGRTSAAETVYELYYKCPVTGHLDAKVDVQRVQLAAGGERPPFAVLAMRLLFSFSTADEAER